jgi:hypothetical protein
MPGQRWGDLGEARVGETQELHSLPGAMTSFVGSLLGEREHLLDALLGDPRAVFR